MNKPRTTRIGLALGSGASRGWSHIGVLKALRREGIEPDVICGTSIGAMIGAAYIAGNLDKLENWVLSATQLDVFKFFEIHLTQVGFVDTDRFQQFLHDYVVEKDTLIENLSMPYAAVATDVKSGREIWLTEGNTLEATRASMALPGLFPSVQLDNKWLVDGGLVNPVPVSTCRALGADFVIAVNLNANILGRRVKDHSQEEPPQSSGLFGRVLKSAKDYSESVFPAAGDETPGMFDVVANSINIFQDRITRSRLAGDPADVVINPKLAHIGMLDFQSAAEAIQEGDHRTMRAIEDIKIATLN